jgi:hypothetical protein
MGSLRMTSDIIVGVCPKCGPTPMDRLTSGLWDGWSGPDLLPASGVCYTGRCRRCGSILETLLAGDEEPNSAPWSPVDEDRLEAIEWVIGGQVSTPHRSGPPRSGPWLSGEPARWAYIGAIAGPALAALSLLTRIGPRGLLWLEGKGGSTIQTPLGRIISAIILVVGTLAGALLGFALEARYRSEALGAEPKSDARPGHLWDRDLDG